MPEPVDKRVGVLEDQMSDVKGMLKTLIENVHSLAESNKQTGKKAVDSTSEESSGGSTHTESRLAGKKLKLPLFDGDDHVAWITRAEIYFDVQNTSDVMRVKLSRLSMEGSTIHWFNLLMETEDDLSWEKLKKSLIARYGGRRLENPFEELATLKHSGTVEEFVEAFELLSSQVGRLPEDQYLGYFMSGLKPQIRRRVRTLNPLNRMQMMRIAKDVEEELRDDDDDDTRSGSKKGVQNGMGRSDWAELSQRNRNGFRDPNRSFISGWSNPGSKTGSNASSIKTTSSAVSTGRKGEGDSKSEEEEFNDEGEIAAIEEANSELENEEEEVECKSMGGASHNFISPQVTTALGLAITPIPEKNIKLGDGHKVVCKGVCKAIMMKLGPIDIVVDALVLELGGLDMVLGISWLSTLGEVVMDWNALSMQFMYEGKQVRQNGGGPHFMQIEGVENTTPMRLKGTLHKFQKSMSEFSSPVILVKKKDASWRMCVDYIALNKATIPDKYPIPIVDELLDELHGASIFSKIDLKSGYHQIRVHTDDIHKTAFRTHNGHYDKDMSTHEEHLSQVLSVLLEHCFVANQKKCRFECKQIDYLGHIILGEGVAVDPEKIKCIMEWPVPKTIKGVRGFLGLTRYYRKFIRNYGKMAKLLTELTKKDNFSWGIEADDAFKLLKSVMTSPPVLTLPNFSIPFEIECDAAGRGIGAHWRHYLLGKKFTVYIDHRSLKHFMQQNVTSPDQQCWLAKLLGYQFEVKFKPGLENKAADALSRCYDEAYLNSMVSYPQWIESKKLLDEVSSDPYIQSLIQTVLDNPAAKPGFAVKQGVLFYHGRLVLSPQSPSIPHLLEEFHATPASGHSGFLRTYRRLADNLQKYAAITPGGLLQPLPIPNGIWEDLSLDFVTGLPKSKGFEAILVVVDRLSKYSHFILLKHPYSAKSIAELFMKEIVRLHGIPSSLGTKLQMISAYHHESDGQTEYNTMFHVSIGTTPFEIVYGRKPPGILRFLSNETKVEVVALELKDRDEALSQLKAHLQKAQEQMAAYANKKIRDLQFSVGEWVFLKLRPHRQQSVIKRTNQKLAARFYGPFKTCLPYNEILKGQFPEFSLEDKTVHKEGGVDGNMNQKVGLDMDVGPEPRVWRVYKRKRGCTKKGNDVVKIA
ncbi:hypothetical protein TSUD_83440 [Trifolium subterraneum]|uniref:RNA-directed DNA polymerase n=1 Tax=Trifolium subterraneum TaxID=3900 RepID=A0A2Z6NXJ8_TRISU|nr:hypothetical protein TSUD_83440 [Trifolium subterraneum]